MFSLLTGICDRVFAVVGALICAQAPMFIQQYSQQLSGHVDELKLQVDAIAHAASLGHKSVSQYIQRFIDSGDQDFVLQGELMHHMALRYENLSNALQRLHDTSLWAKPFVFLRNLQWEIAESTFKDFQFGIPFTSEGILYALIGIGIGYGIFSFFSTLVYFCYSTLRRMVMRLWPSSHSPAP